MPDVVWGGLHTEPGTPVCTNMGIQPGPVGGDGWQKLASLPTSKLLPGRHYAFVVSGTVRNIQRSGAVPNRGLIQVVLGDDSGVRSARQCFELGVNWPSGPSSGGFGGVPFQFLVIFSPTYGVTEPAWGSTWPNVDDLSLYGRTFWNGDTPAYAVSFEVHGITWLWFDLDNIGDSRHFADQHAPASPVQQLFTGALQLRHVNPTPIPADIGQKWLHFINLAFTPIADGTAGGMPRFQHERVRLSGPLVVEVGNHQWGCFSRGAPYNAAFRAPTMHFGSHFIVDPDSSTEFVQYRGDGEALIYGWRHFAVRIDQLPEVSARTTTDVGPSSTAVTVFHEPPPLTGSIAQPIYLASLRAWDVSSIAGLRSHRVLLRTYGGRILWDGPPVDSLTGEGVPIFGASQFGLVPGDGPRYEHIVLQSSPDPALAGDGLRVDDAHFCQLWLIEDPSIEPPEPPVPGDNVYLIPTREGAAIGAQTSLPAGAEWRNETPFAPKEWIRGGTGVRRTWPLFTGPRRQWTLVWSALTNAEGIALEAALRASKTFKGRPPQDSADVAVITLEQPRLTMIAAPGPSWSVSVPVAELVFVGGA